MPFTRASVGDFDVDLFSDFFHGLVNHAQLTLHIDNLKGENSHHQAETVFKAFGRALRMAVSADERAPSPCHRPRAFVVDVKNSCRYRLRQGNPSLG